jgi:NADH:ubiquinone oxidoreductase subunit F (NADH-binding)
MAGVVEHERAYGSMPAISRSSLIDEVDRSGLRGRGGADFPTATKLRAVASRRSVSAVVVNGSETEPASLKDRLLISSLPHLVLDGAVAAAIAVGARAVIVKLDPRGRGARQAVEDALAERSDKIPMSVVVGGGGYVSGEESAVINFLNAKAAVPTFVPPRPFERGYRNRPTLVQNAETLAQLALIARFGAAWFREVGTQADPGTVLTTVSGAVADPGVYELAFGTPLRDLLEAAGGPTEPLQATLIGGYFGTWATWREAAWLQLSRASLRESGHALGAGVLIALGSSACGLHESAGLVRYLAGESAGQCGPCVHGLAAISESFSRLVDDVGAADERQRLLRWAGQLKDRGACHHPNGVIRLVRSSLQTFGEELARHPGRRCTARIASLAGVDTRPRVGSRRL